MIREPEAFQVAITEGQFLFVQRVSHVAHFTLNEGAGTKRFNGFNLNRRIDNQKKSRYADLLAFLLMYILRLGPTHAAKAAQMEYVTRTPITTARSLVRPGVFIYHESI